MYQLQVSNFATIQHIFDYVSKRVAQYMYVLVFGFACFFLLVFFVGFLFSNFSAVSVVITLITINYKIYATALRVHNIEYV